MESKVLRYDLFCDRLLESTRPKKKKIKDVDSIPSIADSPYFRDLEETIEYWKNKFSETDYHPNRDNIPLKEPQKEPEEMPVASVRKDIQSEKEPEVYHPNRDDIPPKEPQKEPEVYHPNRDDIPPKEPQKEPEVYHPNRDDIPEKEDEKEYQPRVNKEVTVIGKKRKKVVSAGK